MAYLGRQPAIGRYAKLDDFASSFNGSTTTFNLTSGGDAQVVQSEAQLIVSLGGIIQEPETDYTVSGSQISFTTAPLSGDDFFAILFGDTFNVGVPSDNTIQNRHIKSDASIAMSKLDGSSGSLSALTVDNVIVNGSKVRIGAGATGSLGGNLEVSTGSTGAIATFQGASGDELYVTNRASAIVGFTTNSADAFEVKSNTTQFVDQSNASIATFTTATSNIAGNLGVNTASPAFTGSGGGIEVTNSTAAIVRAESSAGALQLKRDGSIGSLFDLSAGLALGASNSEVMRLVGGKVGIGTSAPLADLHIRHDSGSTNQLLLTYSTTDHLGFIAGGSGCGLTVTSDNFFTINHQPAADRGGESNLTERLRIDTAGKVGIGTTSPSSKLHVYGASEAALTLGAANTRSGLFLHKPGTTTVMGSALLLASDETFRLGTASHYHMQMYQNGSINFYASGSIAATLATTGRLGIGTTSPDRLLDVSGTGNVYGKFQSTNATGAGIELKDSGEDWLIQADDGAGAGGLAFYDLGRTAYRVMFDANGRVGIGTNSPSSDLTFGGASGGIHFTDSSKGIYYDGNELVMYTTGADDFVTLNGESYVRFNTNSQEAMRILLNRNVGIGTTSPLARLHTNGDANSRAFHSYSNQTTVDSTQYGFYIDHNTTFSGTAVPSGTDRVAYGVYLDSDFSGTFAATTTSGQRFFHRAHYVHANASHSTGTLYEIDGSLVQAVANASGSGNTDRLYGLQSYTYDYETTGKTAQISNIAGAMKRTGATGTTTSLYGTSTYSYIYTGAGNTTNAYGANAYVANYASSTITTAVGVRGYITGDAGTISNGYGGYFNNYFTGTMTNGYGVYTSGFAREHFAGNVGIKTTSPAVELHISSPQPEVRLQDSDGTNQYGQMYQAGGVTYFLTRNNTSNGQYYWNLYDGTTLSTKMIMNTSGNVGIATTSPSAKLDVVGEVQGSSGFYVTDGYTATGYSQTNTTDHGQYQAGFTDRHGSARASFEWGHSNGDGYGSTLACSNGGGAPYIGFSCGPGTVNNTWRTFGIRGLALMVSHGIMYFYDVADAGSNGVGQNNQAPSGTANKEGTDSVSRITLNATNGNASFSGAVSKGSGSFLIEHPLDSKKDTHNLAHSFIEGPQADLIYRGKVVLSSGAATVNIDAAAGMTSGTFEALCTDVQCFTSNETGWTAVKGSVSGATLTIQAQDNSCTDTISWMVVGERKDKHMIDTDWTDSNGKVIVEPLKPEEDSP